MKFSTALTSLILIIPLFTGEALGAAAIGRANGGKGGNKGGGKGGAGGKGAGAGKGAAQNSTAAAGAGAANATAAAANAGAAAANATAAANNTVLANNGAANNTGAAAAGAAGAANGNDQTSLTLNPNVIAKGFAQNGQQTPVAGQVASLTSTNNFINFCLTTNKPLTNGQQIKTGSCNPAPMGVIAATTNMPSSKFVSPVNGQNIQANTAFNIQMAVSHLQTGNFVNAEANYYAAPQQVNAQGDIIGHTHFTVSAVQSFTSTTPLDPNTFAFFKGVNGAAQGGVVTEAVANGLPAGTYRLCSINTDANHTPCLVAVAQHGTLDDCVYFSVGGNGNNNNPFGGAANATGAGAGAAGAAGAAGKAGAAGAAGNAGAAGAAGNAGAAGAAGNATAAGAAGNATAAGAAGAAGNATASAPPAASSAATGAVGKGAGAGKGVGKGAGAGKGAAGAGKGGRAGGRSVRLGYRESRLGRDY